MASNVLMPKMGYDMTEGKILRWLKQPGDAVKKGEAIAEIETDKVTIEIEAFVSGVLAKILVPAGQSAKVGEPIAIVAAPGEKVEAPAPAGEATAVQQAQKQPEHLPARPPEPEPAKVEEGERLKASPLAKKLAAEAGVDLHALHGTGPAGRIVRRDVEGALAAPAPGARPAAPAATPAGGQQVPLSAMRQAIGRRMSASIAPVPHFYVTMAVRMDAAMALRAQINAGLAHDEAISVNDLLVKACALALREHPDLNAEFRGEALYYPPEIAISVAVALEGGLIAPDIHQADLKAIGAIAREIKDKAARARSGHLKPDEFGRGTFTVSNLGMFGVEAFTAIVTPPQSAVVAVGAVQDEAVVHDGQLMVGQVMRFTVSADHRVTDGAGSARFAGTVKQLLENPLRLLI
ncbi:MAG TPA: dihydrolipoamide acetyltransferase family protein [Oscillatoriaceae cyanobacterium]